MNMMLIYLNTLYNHRDDWENRFRLRYKKITDGFEDGFESLGNGRFKTTARIERQTKGGIDDDRNKGTRLEDQKASNITLGGDHLAASKLKIDWMVNFSRASEERPNERTNRLHGQTNQRAEEQTNERETD